MRKSASGWLTVVLAVGGGIFSLGAIATPLGVPVANPAPLSCATTNYAITAITGASGEYPIATPCNPNDATQGTCSAYGYRVTSPTGATVSHSLFAVSADQDLYGTTPSSSVADLGAGDSTTGFLKYTRHEYPIRFNSNASVFEAYIYIKGASSPRIGTAYIRGGRIDESCLIAGPGVPVPVNRWAPTTSSQDVVAAGGKCAATLKYNATGKLTGITLPPGSLCKTGKIPAGRVLAIGGKPVRDANGPITFGNGTTTIYMPDGWAICTVEEPLCPGETTYVYE